MKRLIHRNLIQTAAMVEICFLGTVTKTTVRKLYSTSSSLFRKDSPYDSVPPTVSTETTDKGPNGGYNTQSSGRFSNLLAPALKQNIEQLQQATSASSLLHSSMGDSLGKVSNLNSHLFFPDDTSLLASRRVDPSTVRQVYYFDTLAFSKKLESKGFTREQAEGFAESLVEIINTTLDHQGRHMVTKPQQEIAVQQLMSEIVSVKKDMTLLQKSEFSSLKTETEKISIELSQVQGHMNDEIVKLKGQFSLDINLERGRAIEAHAENEKRLQQLHNKIETEIANLKTIYEVYRNDVFKYAGGTVIAVGGLILGVLRLWH
ncbi:unnamed protein product [Candidula unifasciata]|uniref:Uncharacterized protein n=1 Tax=Candidula unifasciata TaxID=100452 RepID=A0A8S3ZRJ3_9EUPU|nr:unnamed protein product [Candidula unifasciata]